MQHTRPTRRLVGVVAASLIGILALSAAPAVARPSAGPGEQSAPEWLPLRRNLDGGEMKVGCTHQSYGSQNGYSCGGHHDYWALDLMADQGTPVYAAGAGFATNGSGQSGSSGYGNVVRIDHGDGVESIYAHLSEVLLPAEGAWVDQDTVIGLVGSTGVSSAPHLHFEVRKPPLGGGAAAAVDPGPLKACVLARVVEYPQIRDVDTWDHAVWGSFSVFSDGTACEVPDAAAAVPMPARPTGLAIAEQLPSGWLIMALASVGQSEPTG